MSISPPALLKRSARRAEENEQAKALGAADENLVIRRQREDSFFSANESTPFTSESSPHFGVSPRFGIASEPEHEGSRTPLPPHTESEDTVEDLMSGLEVSLQNIRLSDNLGIKLPPSLPLTPLPKHRTYVISSDDDDGCHEGDTGTNLIASKQVDEEGDPILLQSSDSSSGPISTIRRRKGITVPRVESTSSAILDDTGSLNPNSRSAENSLPASPNVLSVPKAQRKAATVAVTKRLRPAERQKLAQSWYAIYNEIVFNNQLPKDAAIVWNPRLRKTAGQAVFVRFNKECSYHDAEEDQLETMMQGLALTPRSSRNGRYELKRIDLSPKILTTEDKLATTLLHECCHVAQRLLETQNDPPHGPVFKRWATKASHHFPQFKVTTRHDFALDQPHRWLCDSCNMVYKRYSKSIDPNKHRCGIKGCRGHLTYLGAFNPDGSAKTSGGANKPLSQYQLFVKTHYNTAYTQEGSHTAAMLWLSQKWKESKKTNN